MEHLQCRKRQANNFARNTSVLVEEQQQAFQRHFPRRRRQGGRRWTFLCGRPIGGRWRTSKQIDGKKSWHTRVNASI